MKKRYLKLSFPVMKDCDDNHDISDLRYEQIMLVDMTEISSSEDTKISRNLFVTDLEFYKKSNK